MEKEASQLSYLGCYIRVCVMLKNIFRKPYFPVLFCSPCSRKVGHLRCFVEKQFCLFGLQKLPIMFLSFSTEDSHCFMGFVAKGFYCNSDFLIDTQQKQFCVACGDWVSIRENGLKTLMKVINRKLKKKSHTVSAAFFFICLRRVGQKDLVFIHSFIKLSLFALLLSYTCLSPQNTV